MVVVVSLAAWIAFLALVAGLCRTARLGDRQLGVARNDSRVQASSQAAAQPAERHAWPAPTRSGAAMQAGTFREAPWGEP
jgi:hypothetical protein